MRRHGAAVRAVKAELDLSAAFHSMKCDKLLKYKQNHCRELCSFSLCSYESVSLQSEVVISQFSHVQTHSRWTPELDSNLLLSPSVERASDQTAMQLLPLLKQVPASGIPRASNLVNNDTENKQNSTYFPGSTSVIWKPVEIKFITLTKSTLHYGTEYKASWDLSSRGVWHQLDWSTPTYLDLTSVGIHMTHTCFTPQRRVKECSSNRFIISKGIIKSIWKNTLRNRVT